MFISNINLVSYTFTLMTLECRCTKMNLVKSIHLYFFSLLVKYCLVFSNNFFHFDSPDFKTPSK